MGRRGRGSPRFTVDEVASVLALAASPPAGRTLEERVTATLERLGRLVAYGGAFVHWTPAGWQRGPTRILHSSIPAECGRDYVGYYHTVDPMGPTIALAEAKLVCLSDFISDARLPDLEFFELLRATDVRRIAGITVPAPPRGVLALALHRGPGAPDFTAKERLVIELVARVFGNLVATDGPRDQALERLGLTARQRGVALLVANGLGDREVARELGLGVATVQTHLRRVFAALRVQNRTELARVVFGLARPTA